MRKHVGRIILGALCLPFALASATCAETVPVAVCQMRVEDGAIEVNLAKAEKFVRQAKADGAKICVLPELVDVGFGNILKAKRPPRKLAFPIPGKTSDRLGEIARKHDVWISAALLEAVPGGAYDTNVLIDNRGKVVHKQRKAFVYPSFAGMTAFQGNYLDVRAVPSPWGPIAVMNCADIQSKSKRATIAAERPALILVNFANGQASLPPRCVDLAKEAGCPVVGVNMISLPGARHQGGKSHIVDASGRALWVGPAVETVHVAEVTTPDRRNRAPRVVAGDVQTVRLPRNRVTLNGLALDEALPGGMKLAWSKLRGPGKVTFDTAQDRETNASFSLPGVYVLKLTADDGNLAGSDTVSVNVLPADGGDPHLVGYWTFDRTTDDRSGKDNHANLHGQAVYAKDPAPTRFPNTHALSLKKQAYVTVPHSRSLDAPHAVTVALWVKLRANPPMWPTRKSGWVGLLSKGKWWKENYAIGLGEYFYLFGRGFGGINCPSLERTVRTLKRWHHVAIVIDADKREGKIYLGGVLNHRVFKTLTSETNAEPIYMGTFGHESVRLEGLLDDVRLWCRPLSDAEIAALVPGAKVNQPPVVNAGPDLRLPPAQKATLKGTFKDDDAFPSARTAGWTLWRKVSGPGEVHFENIYSPTTIARFTRPGAYLLEFRVSDGAHLASDTVKVTATEK